VGRRHPPRHPRRVSDHLALAAADDALAKRLYGSHLTVVSISSPRAIRWVFL
jgi:hypothetical protein